MPLTRSASRATTGLSSLGATGPAKRKAKGSSASPSKKLRLPSIDNNESSSNIGEQFVPATLNFSFNEGKEHLIDVDARFEKLFNNIPCKPFEQLEAFHPFRSLTTSILGQQISWMAARSITHRFKRLFDPTLPEQPSESPLSFFPSPEQVAGVSIETLRSAGLSTRKAEYVKDLASRFVDGRLSARNLMEASDEEVMRLLLQVRGIGKWTVDMFSIFSMRRPDILPLGDLGVQRGLLKWYLSLHKPDYSLGTPSKTSELASPGLDGDMNVQEDNDSKSVFEGAIPPPLTPNTRNSLRRHNNRERQLQPLPSGLSASVLKSRLDGRKVKGAFLTPLEMEELTNGWRPYRSLGVYYMWSLSEGKGM
ncbi:hypothetical protein APHAL10511_004943 [Amanita phalloides]|nr:hypothetical protein APHAL10511_004943 [Amanita phalloides]